MIKKCVHLIAGMSLVAIAGSCFAASEPTAKDVEVKFNKILRNTKVTSVKLSPIPGLYEVISGPNLFYFAPAGEGHLLFGQIVDKDGKNLTGEIQAQLKDEFQKIQGKKAAEKLKTMDLSLAVKIGNGPNTVIEFTDPDCPYCRKVDKFFTGRTDVTRYVFLNPIDQLHPQSRAKSVFILSSKDEEKALRDVFTGKYDKAGLPILSADLSAYPKESNRLVAGMKIGEELGVQGTPMLFVNGSMVNGADIAKISQLLNK